VGVSRASRWSITAAFAAALALGGSLPASASFVSFTGSDPACSGNECFLFLDTAITGTGSSNFGATVGGQSGPLVNIATNTNVTSGGGFAVLTPAGAAALTSVTFTPTNNQLFGDFSFRGILTDPGDVTINVLDALGASFSHTFSISTPGNF